MSLLYVGHDDFEDRDYLLTIWEDGSLDLAVREGRDSRNVTWSPPISLIQESSEISDALGSDPGEVCS